MAQIEIKDAKDLEAFANTTVATVEEVKGSTAAIAAEVAAKETRIAELERVNKLFEDRLKSIMVQVEQFTPVKEVSEEGKLYRLGAMVNHMFKAERGGPKEKAEAAKFLARIGAFPTQSVPGHDGKPTWSVRESYIPRLKAALRKQYGGYVEKAALSSDPLASDDSDDSDFFGSYVVPVDTAAELMRIAADASAMMSRVTHMPVRGITTYVPYTTDSFAFTRLTDQETANTEDTLTLARSTLTTRDYAFWIAITEDMDEDSLIALGALIRTMGGEAWGTQFDTLALSDTTYGAMSTSGVNQIILGAGDTGFSSVEVDDLAGMPSQLNTQGKRNGAVYMAHTTVWDTLENEKDADGRYVLRMPSEMAPLRIRGYEVVRTDGMPDSADSAASTDFLLFGNPRRIIAGDRVGFEFRIYNQTESSMKYGQIFLRCRVRQAMATTLPTSFVKLTTAAS